MCNYENNSFKKDENIVGWWANNFGLTMFKCTSLIMAMWAYLWELYTRSFLKEIDCPFTVATSNGTEWKDRSVTTPLLLCS